MPSGRGLGRGRAGGCAEPGLPGLTGVLRAAVPPAPPRSPQCSPNSSTGARRFTLTLSKDHTLYVFLG